MHVLNATIHHPWPQSLTVRPQRSSGRGDAERTFEPGHVNAALVEALASAADEDPTRIEPLYQTIDTDAIAAMFRSAADGVTLQFVHDGFHVEVDGAGTIRVTPVDG